MLCLPWWALGLMLAIQVVVLMGMLGCLAVVRRLWHQLRP